MKKMKLVMVGNGMAGVRTIEELLKIEPDLYDITVFGAEPRGGYNRILLPDVLGGSRDAREIFLNPVDWYAEHRVTLRAGVSVVAVDRRARTVKRPHSTPATTNSRSPSQVRSPAAPEMPGQPTSPRPTTTSTSPARRTGHGRSPNQSQTSSVLTTGVAPGMMTAP